MASTLVKIDIHLIFHLKSTSPYIRDCDLVRVCAYISGIIRKTESIPIIVNGMSDHIHILCSLPKTIALSDFVRTIKSESSRWVKGIDKHYAKFAWQEGYGAFSVSPTLLEKTENYIQNQQEHHKKRSSIDEYKLFLEAHGVSYDEKYAFVD